MKGVVLAGGTGSRLNPLTRVTNKHLLPIYDKPMVYYPIQTLVNAGIEEILVVTGGNNAGDFLRLLGNGRDFGLKHTARSIAADNGVPLLPGTPLLSTVEDALLAAGKIGYPVMLKSTAGGGGINTTILTGVSATVHLTGSHDTVTR